MTTILEILGTSTPVSEVLAEKIGYVRAAIACRVFFYQQLDNGLCSASVATLAKKLGMSTGTISNNLKWLRENDYIKVIGEHKSGNVTNKYKVSKKFYDDLKHSSNESEHSGDESNIHLMKVNIQEMNGKEEIEEDSQEEIKENYNGHHKIENNFSIICTEYQNNIGFLSPILVDKLKDILNDIPPDLQVEWCKNAIAIAIENNVRKFSYMAAILDGWIAAGTMTTKEKKSEPGLKTSKYPEPEPVYNDKGELVGTR